MSIINTVFGRTAVDSTWSKIRTRMSRTPDSFGRIDRRRPCLVNVVSPGTEYLPHLKQLDIRMPDFPRRPNQPGRGIYSSMIPRYGEYEFVVTACRRGLHLADWVVRHHSSLCDGCNARCQPYRRIKRIELGTGPEVQHHPTLSEKSRRLVAADLCDCPYSASGPLGSDAGRSAGKSRAGECGTGTMFGRIIAIMTMRGTATSAVEAVQVSPTASATGGGRHRDAHCARCSPAEGRVSPYGVGAVSLSGTRQTPDLGRATTGTEWRRPPSARTILTPRPPPATPSFNP